MKLGIKSGTFTLLTKGHVDCLDFCKQYCDKLIVVINDDKYLKNKKGFVAVPLEERCRIVKAIRYVDYVIPYSEPNEEEIIKTICEEWRREYEDISEPLTITIFHALETHNKDFVPGRGIVDDIVFCPNTESSSTSDIMAKIYHGTKKDMPLII